LLIEPTELEGVVLLCPKRFEDPRGFFAEVWNHQRFAETVADVTFVQDNQSLSRHAGTLRGLHYQAPPHAQAKLVRCGRGRLLDVAVDVRRGSPTWGRWVARELTAHGGEQMFVPVGFLHGFVSLEPDTEILYKCSDYYAPDCDGAVRYDDPELGIDWRTDLSRVVVSDKDAAAPTLDEWQSPFRFET
jgi:dTDP-4-dehydrorhamnose 3,5-epimerase